MAHRRPQGDRIMKLRFIAPVVAAVGLIAAPAMAATGTGHHHKAKTEKPAKPAKPAKAAKAPK